jgi:hypothetical protein
MLHRCYIFGSWTGCVALCRATLEAALGEKLQEQVNQVANSELRLKDLIDISGAFKLVDVPAEGCARQVQQMGNRALHPESRPYRITGRDLRRAYVSARCAVASVRRMTFAILGNSVVGYVR